MSYTQLIIDLSTRPLDYRWQPKHEAIDAAIDAAARFEIRACCKATDAGGSPVDYIEECLDEDAEFFGVYFTLNDGRSMHVVDAPTREAAEQLVTEYHS